MGWGGAGWGVLGYGSTGWGWGFGVVWVTAYTPGEGTPICERHVIASTSRRYRSSSASSVSFLGNASRGVPSCQHAVNRTVREVDRCRKGTQAPKGSGSSP